MTAPAAHRPRIAHRRAGRAGQDADSRGPGPGAGSPRDGYTAAM